MIVKEIWFEHLVYYFCNCYVDVFCIFICDIITEIFKTVNLFSSFVRDTDFSANGVFLLKSYSFTLHTSDFHLRL
jgi:hypothetical protein